MFVTDLGVGQMEVNVFMKDKVRKIMQSSVKMTYRAPCIEVAQLRKKTIRLSVVADL